MSSTERAPEPTMEEILASIRRIISDDESSSARQRTASASHRDEEGLEAAEGEADDRIINDIARVLSGSATAAEEEEDILDLTAELGGMEPVEEPLPDEADMPIEASTPPPGFQPAPATLEQPAELAPEPSAQAAPPLTASEEAASALERAIAALRAGHVPTSVPGSMPEFTVPEFAAQPEPEPEPQPELPAFAPEPEPELEPEPDLVLTEFEAEMIVEEPVEIEATLVSEAAESPAWESEAAPWTGAPEPLVEPERQGGRVNGGTHAAASPLEASNKTLEDSVKDMLRPMLRQWLDENMPRMVTAALKDELGDNSARGQED